MGNGKWAFGLLRIGIIGVIMFARVTWEDQTGVPDAGLLCISNCATCPVICSPPPPPSTANSHPPPSPPVHYSPPPPHSVHHSPPPPPPSQPPLSPPSPSNPTWETPPPPINYPNIPPGQSSPMVGSRNYSYPYYYFYSSKAAPISLPGSILSFFLLPFTSIVLFLCC